jgi:hypothetical protein
MAEPSKITVVGVHLVEEAREPCYLIEIAVEEASEPDFGAITQEDFGRPSTEWQVAYDEQMLPSTALEESRSGVGYLFFFHYLDLYRPLLVAGAVVELPLRARSQAG